MERHLKKDDDFFANTMDLYAFLADRCDVFPGILPDINMRGTGAWDTVSWMDAPMPYEKVRPFLEAILIRSRDEGGYHTFKSLRCWLPTLGHCAELSEAEAQALSNWQEIPHTAAISRDKARASFPMARRYAATVEEQAAIIKARLMQFFFELGL